jgi:DNA-binding transcriptional ArsR family regulator/uncharacterized protein YndB with AHSA1/START domain
METGASRRQILDLLRQRPHTTGELAAQYVSSRLAVMKHLKVLEVAGLVAVRRRGRERWNYLDAIPLQRMIERWLQPYRSSWAAALLKLQRYVEATGGTDMPQSNLTTDGINVIQIAQDLHLAAPRAAVFAALTGDLSAWWGAPYLQDATRAQTVTREPRLGGLMFERWSDNERAIWAVVTDYKQDARIILRGAMAMPGVVEGYIRFDLEDAQDGGTDLKLTHHAMGEVNNELRVGYHGGWEDLLGNRLRAWVENGEKLGIGHEPPQP